MEWDFKDFGGWDSSDEKEEDSDLAALVGSSSISEQHLPSNRSPAAASLEVDLKLATDDSSGHVYGQNGPVNNLLKDPIKPSASKSKVDSNNNNNNNHQKVSCLVDGCKADLSRCREYHRRHRVCELHSKTPVVVLRGEQKRFCQQCSRFHSLLEFDEVKRSCRKRLNGHNQRRRKPKPESLYFSPNFLSSYKGPRILQFGNPQLCATSNVRGLWPVEAKNGAETMLYNRHPPWLNATGGKRSPPNSFSIGGGGDKPFLFLQTNDDLKLASASHRAAPQDLMSQQQPLPTSETRKGGHIVSCDGMTRDIDSGCALYLLSSSHSTQNQNPVTGLIQSNATTPQQNQQAGFSEFSYSNDVQEDDKPVSPEMVLLTGADGFFDNGAQMLPIL